MGSSRDEVQENQRPESELNYVRPQSVETDTLKTLLINGTIVNEGTCSKGALLIEDALISAVVREEDFKYFSEYQAYLNRLSQDADVQDVSGMHVFPGVIDDHVHFREPGSGKSGTIESESAAAVIGGVTSFMDMPNNVPAAVSLELLDRKFDKAGRSSYANYSFYLGASNDNLQEIKALDPKRVCGVKVFMGSSTGNLVVDRDGVLEDVFRYSPVLIAAHCEDNCIIAENMRRCAEKYGDDIPSEAHPVIRSGEACLKSTERAIGLADKYGSKLHILHISTSREVEALRKKREDALSGGEACNISGEACVHYLWFNSNDYKKYGNLIKCNPAIKDESDMSAIRDAVAQGIISVIGTDHAPHPLGLKLRPYQDAPGGIPLVQYSLQMMLELAKSGVFTLEQIADRMSHAPARLFNISKRGFIKEGYYADLVVVDLSEEDTHSAVYPASMCGWSPFSEIGPKSFSSTIVSTYVNGSKVAEKGKLTGVRNAMPLEFNRSRNYEK